MFECVSVRCVYVHPSLCVCGYVMIKSISYVSLCVCVYMGGSMCISVSVSMCICMYVSLYVGMCVGSQCMFIAVCM